MSPEERIQRTLGTLVTWCIILTVGLLGVLGLGIVGIVDASNASEAAVSASHEATVVARNATVLATDIAQARQQTILRDCSQQNARHRATVSELDRILRASRHKHISREQRLQIRASRHATILIIDQLAPLENCQQQLALDQNAG